MPMNGSFNAQQYAPKQVGTAHPTGKFPAQISNTTIEPTKDNLAGKPEAKNDGMFIVEFNTPGGQIVMRYNLWNQSEKAVTIANGQLSALCHATGVFQLDWQNDGAALRGARCMIEVVDQIDKETKLPNGYTQISKVYDANGNEPGKAQSAAPQAQPQQQAAPPMVQQPGGSWGAPAVTAAPAAAQPAWGAGQPAQQAPQPQQQAPSTWQQPAQQPVAAGGAAPNPPWANRG